MAENPLAEAVRKLVSRYPQPLSDAESADLGAGLQQLATDYGAAEVLIEASRWMDKAAVARPAALRDPLLDQPVASAPVRPGQKKNIRY